MTTGVLFDILGDVCGGLGVAVSRLSRADDLTVPERDDLFFLLRLCRDRLEQIQDALPGEDVQIGKAP